MLTYSEIKKKYKKLFELTKNIYKNPNIFNEISLEETQENDQLFNDFLVDINNCDYPEEFERCIIYHHPESEGIQCLDMHSSKVMSLAREVENRPENNSNLELKKEAAQYLTFSYRDIENKLTGFVMIFGMYYLEKQEIFNPEAPIYGCTFSLNPLICCKSEQRDIGISAVNSNGNDGCQSVIFKSYFIEL